MMRKRLQSTLCAQPGCKKYSMLDGSGFCQSHHPGKAESRKQAALIAQVARKKSLTPDKKCTIEGCNAWRHKGGIYCPLHFRIYDPNSGQTSCKKENCRSH